MKKSELIQIIKQIVKEAKKIKDKYTNQHNAPVNYACIFTHSDSEFEEITKLTTFIGRVIQETPTGPLFHINSIKTNAGELTLLKVRKSYDNRLERGDADFTVDDYDKFKLTYVGKPNFNLIERESMEMIELVDGQSDFLVYFSNPPLNKQFKLE